MRPEQQPPPYVSAYLKNNTIKRRQLNPSIRYQNTRKLTISDEKIKFTRNISSSIRIHTISRQKQKIAQKRFHTVQNDDYEDKVRQVQNQDHVMNNFMGRLEKLKLEVERIHGSTLEINEVQFYYMSKQEKKYREKMKNAGIRIIMRLFQKKIAQKHREFLIKLNRK